MIGIFIRGDTEKEPHKERGRDGSDADMGLKKAKDFWEIAAPQKKQGKVLPESSERMLLWFGASGHQDCERIDTYCLYPPGLLWFIMVAPGN